jgi:hypothetical protein
MDTGKGLTPALALQSAKGGSAAKRLHFGRSRQTVPFPKAVACSDYNKVLRGELYPDKGHPLFGKLTPDWPARMVSLGRASSFFYRAQQATVMLNWRWFTIFGRNAAIVIHLDVAEPNTLTPNRRSVA